MMFKWHELKSVKGQMSQWALIHKETGIKVAVVCLSQKGRTIDNWKVRKKIKSAYELYYNKTWFENLEFF